MNCSLTEEEAKPVLLEEDDLMDGVVEYEASAFVKIYALKLGFVIRHISMWCMAFGSNLRLRSRGLNFGSLLMVGFTHEKPSLPWEEKKIYSSGMVVDEGKLTPEFPPVILPHGITGGFMETIKFFDFQSMAPTITQPEESSLQTILLDGRHLLKGNHSKGLEDTRDLDSTAEVAKQPSRTP
ncbi:hypothetical protein LIER_04478 [Lithospermum erythrorhizon]|uniref:Uncharacterized protein n=1 Tax=Lithospermum erythrorhizon TaxID=34254 RepID=A0AAV3NWU8_LITER